VCAISSAPPIGATGGFQVKWCWIAGVFRFLRWKDASFSLTTSCWGIGGTTLLSVWWGCDCVRALADFGTNMAAWCIHVCILDFYRHILHIIFFILHNLAIVCLAPPVQTSTAAREAATGDARILSLGQGQCCSSTATSFSRHGACRQRRAKVGRCQLGHRSQRCGRVDHRSEHRLERERPRKGREQGLLRYVFCEIVHRAFSEWAAGRRK